MLKAVVAAMVLIFGASLFAAGALGSDGCGMKCCCQTGSNHMQPSAEQQMRSPMGCCSGVPFSPCDIKSSKPFDLPEIIPASCCVYHTDSSGISVILIDTDNRSQNPGAKFIAQFLDPKIKAPPIYLEISSFLI